MSLSVAGREFECYGGPLDGDKRAVVDDVKCNDRFAFPVSVWDQEAGRTVIVDHIYRFDGKGLQHEGPAT